MRNYELLPEHIRKAVKAYVEDRIQPGGFLTAVIQNNLVESFKRADHINIKRMSDIVEFFYNEVPSACWGSSEKMKKWLNKIWLDEE